MKKLNANRSRANAARVAKAQRKHRPPQFQPATPSSVGQNPWLRTKRAWVRLQRWKKIAAGVVTAAVSAFAAAPHFSIERATTNSPNPYSADFVIQNIGWVPAQYVNFRCAFSKDHSFSIGSSTVTISNIYIAKSISSFAYYKQNFITNCGVSAPGAIPKSGGITAFVDFNFFMLPIILHSSQYFSFQYDSTSGGYVYVPDTAH